MVGGRIVRDWGRIVKMHELDLNGELAGDDNE